MASTGSSRAAKPVNDYLSSPGEGIGILIDRYGDYLERISAQRKMLLASAIADHMASAHDNYPMQSSIESIDPDNILSDRLKSLLVQIADESNAHELNCLLTAIVAQHGDDIRNGAYPQCS